MRCKTNSDPKPSQEKPSLFFQHLSTNFDQSIGFYKVKIKLNGEYQFEGQRKSDDIIPIEG